MEQAQDFAANASGKLSSGRFHEPEPERSEFEQRLDNIANVTLLMVWILAKRASSGWNCA
jgi:hypothetical protein